MSTVDPSRLQPPVRLRADERRRRDAAPDLQAPHRRINDTWFNRVRWPAFIAAWAVLAVLSTAALLSRWFD